LVETPSFKSGIERKYVALISRALFSWQESELSLPIQSNVRAVGVLPNSEEVAFMLEEAAIGSFVSESPIQVGCDIKEGGVSLSITVLDLAVSARRERRQKEGVGCLVEGIQKFVVKASPKLTFSGHEKTDKASFLS